jgi:hypothetical protein
MKIIKWVFLSMFIFSTVGCATVSPGVFSNVLNGNPGISPEELRSTLQAIPDIDQQNNSVRYQVYRVGVLWGAQKAVYFKNGQMVANGPYDKYSNIKMLYQLGAISQDEYNKEYKQYQDDDAQAAAYEQQQQSQGQSLSDWMAQNQQEQEQRDEQNKEEQAIIQQQQDTMQQMQAAALAAAQTN